MSRDNICQQFQVEQFCRQYLQVQDSPAYPDSRYLREESVQEQLYRRLFHNDSLPHSPPQRYTLRILKGLVHRLEASIEDWDEHVRIIFILLLCTCESCGANKTKGVSDSLVSSLSALLSQPLPSEAAAVQQRCYVTYFPSLLGDIKDRVSPAITLLESRSLISASGTTGLRTWEASLHLGQFLCTEPDLVRGKSVLELGTGTGYLSILCAKHLRATSVVASDGSDDVINNLPENFYLNGLEGSGTIVAKDVKWGHALAGTEEMDWSGGWPINVVIGADITYDSSAIPALVATLDDLASLFPGVDIFIAATERNRTTLGAFLQTSIAGGFAVAHIDFPVKKKELQTGPYYSDAAPIHICRLSRAER